MGDVCGPPLHAAGGDRRPAGSVPGMLREPGRPRVGCAAGCDGGGAAEASAGGAAPSHAHGHPAGPQLGQGGGSGGEACGRTAVMASRRRQGRTAASMVVKGLRKRRNSSGLLWSLSMNSHEVWRAVPGFDGKYEVSSLGRVRSVDRRVHSRGGYQFRPGVVLSQMTDTYGYLQVPMHLPPRRWTMKVHRCVALAFIPNPNGKPQINHIDGDKRNNRVENLEWVTAKEHGLHSAKMKLRPMGNNNGSAKLTESDVPDIRRLLADGVSLKKIGLLYGVSDYAIFCIKHGRTWSHITDVATR